MIKSNAWHKQLKIFFHKAKKIKHPITYRDLMQVLPTGMRNALIIFSNVQAQKSLIFKLRQLWSPTNKEIIFFGLLWLMLCCIIHYNFY